jgi:23S rRNA pseudouridine2604 synthase
MTDSIRLAKRVAELRGCSRREAELIITGGWVRVDGVVIEEPQFRVSDQLIEIDAKASAAQAEPVTLLLHKPADYPMDAETLSLLEPATLWSDEASSGIAARIHPLKVHFVRLAACAPLETNSAGLVVFSQDWHVVRRLTEDAATVEHEFVVEVAERLTSDELKQLNQAIPFQGRAPASIKVSWQNENRLRFALKGARPGQIEHLCASVGLQPLGIKRIRLGGVAMGKLPPGKWRYLRGNERF